MNISPAVIKRIEQYARDHNYYPDPTAQSLRTGKSNVLLALLEDINSTLASYIESYAYSKGYIVIFCSHGNDNTRAQDLLHQFDKHHIAGYIIVPTVGLQEAVQQLITNQKPVVFCDRYFPELALPYVVVNNEEAMKKATLSLLDDGSMSCAYIGIESTQTQMAARKKGFEQARLKYRNNTYFFETDIFFNNDSKEQLHQFLKEQINVDILAFATGYLVVEALNYLFKTHPNRLKELKIVTFDDAKWFDFMPVKILSIQQPIEQMAHHCVLKVLELIENKETTIVDSTVLKTTAILKGGFY